MAIKNDKKYKKEKQEDREFFEYFKTSDYSEEFEEDGYEYIDNNIWYNPDDGYYYNDITGICYTSYEEAADID